MSERRAPPAAPPRRPVRPRPGGQAVAPRPLRRRAEGRRIARAGADGAARVLRRRPRRARRRRARTRSTTYRAIFDGAGFNWFVPVGHGDRARAARAQPAADADHHDDAHPHRPRGRVRVPLRAVQHRRPGPVHRRRRLRRLDRLVVRGHELAAAHPRSRSSSRRRCGALWAGIAGLPEGDGRSPRGDLDDHAQLDRDLGRRRSCSALGGPLQNDHAGVRARSRTTSSTAPSCRSSGATRSCRDSTSASSSRSARSSSTGRSSTGRRSATASGRSASTPRRRATAASTSRGTTSSRWRSPARSPASRARSTCSAGSSGSRPATSRRRDDRLRRHRRRAARPQHRRRRRPRGAALRRRSLDGHVDAATSTRGLQARAGVEPDAADPGPRRAVRRRRRDRALAARAAAPEEGAPAERRGARMTSMALPVAARLPRGLARCRLDRDRARPARCLDRAAADLGALVGAGASSSA